MKDYQKLTHTTWDCKYHVVFIPKRRRKVILGAIRKHLGKVLHELAELKECKIVEGHLDGGSYPNVHLHTAEAFGVLRVGYIKGKNAISIAWRFMGKAKNFTGGNFWARGYFISTVGLDEEMIRAYIRHQEKEDGHYDQIKLGM